MIWEEQGDGSFLGVASERAVEFAASDNDKLAAVGFAAFLQATDVPAGWFVDEPTVVTIRGERIGVRADTGTDPDTFTVSDSGEPWTLAARILNGSTPLILLVGVTSQMSDRIDTFGPALPARAFLRMSEWLMQFPHHWRTAA